MPPAMVGSPEIAQRSRSSPDQAGGMGEIIRGVHDAQAHLTGRVARI